jgi:hypothetical protein
MCLDPSQISDTLKIHREQQYYHYTLYYYDRAGNLTATVAPKGVSDLQSNVNNIPKSRNDHPDYTYKTTYEYNSFKQLVSQTTPDGGESRFIYNDVQLRFSQNADSKVSGLTAA